MGGPLHLARDRRGRLAGDQLPGLFACALKVAKCNDAACAGGDETITTVDDPANSVGLYTSLAIGADGLPVISYRDNTAGRLKVAKCNDAACAGGDETITTVDDPANSVGFYTSLAIGADGLPVISYRDNTAGSLKVAKCNDAACAGGDETITTVDDSGQLRGQLHFTRGQRGRLAGSELPRRHGREPQGCQVPEPELQNIEAPRDARLAEEVS